MVPVAQGGARHTPQPWQAAAAAGIGAPAMHCLGHALRLRLALRWAPGKVDRNEAYRRCTFRRMAIAMWQIAFPPAPRCLECAGATCGWLAA
eukprot:scaffold28957_cov112-Isochrysis_galbana.AAC.4